MHLEQTLLVVYYICIYFFLQKIPENIWNLSAQDLLSKSHEELVLLLIHLRRQGATLGEAIDGSRSELENITNTIVTSSDDKDSMDNKRILDDLHLHVKELEERRAKIQPIINLVDNMVKLGSLYRGPSDAPMSHRIRNLQPSANSNNDSPLSKELKDEIQVNSHSFICFLMRVYIDNTVVNIT